MMGGRGIDFFLEIVVMFRNTLPTEMVTSLFLELFKEKVDGHRGTWLVGMLDWLTVGLGDLGGLFQP